jgi:RecB family exonuclease
MDGRPALAGRTTVSGAADRITITLQSGSVPDAIAATLTELRDWLRDADLLHFTAGACTHCQHDDRTAARSLSWSRTQAATPDRG